MHHHKGLKSAPVPCVSFNRFWGEPYPRPPAKGSRRKRARLLDRAYSRSQPLRRLLAARPSFPLRRYRQRLFHSSLAKGASFVPLRLSAHHLGGGFGNPMEPALSLPSQLRRMSQAAAATQDEAAGGQWLVPENNGD